MTHCPLERALTPEDVRLDVAVHGSISTGAGGAPTVALTPVLRCSCRHCLLSLEDGIMQNQGLHGMRTAAERFVAYHEELRKPG